MKNYLIKSYLLPVTLFLLFTSCRQEEPLPDFNENEMITTIRLRFENKVNAADVVLATWKDLDGEGGNPPEIEQINLKPNTNYKLSIDAIFNESAVKAENITQQIAQDAHNHLFVYKTDGINLTVEITDKDKNGLPFGLQTDASTGSSSSGTFRVILRHQVGVKTGSETAGSTDIDITFPVVIR